MDPDTKRALGEGTVDEGSECSRDREGWERGTWALGRAEVAFGQMFRRWMD